MNKKLPTYFLLTLLLTTSCVSQRYRGVYWAPGVEGSATTLYLKSNQRFFYRVSSCTANCLEFAGQGKYVIKKDSLCLNFIGTPDSVKTRIIKNGLVRFTKEKSFNNKISTIYVRAFIDQAPDDKAIITIKSPQRKDKHLIIGQQDGQVKLQIKNEDFPIEIEASYFALETVKVKLEESTKDYNIHFKLSDYHDVSWFSGQKKLRIRKQKNPMTIGGLKKISHK